MVNNNSKKDLDAKAVKISNIDIRQLKAKWNAKFEEYRASWHVKSKEEEARLLAEYEDYNAEVKRYYAEGYISPEEAELRKIKEEYYARTKEYNKRKLSRQRPDNLDLDAEVNYLNSLRAKVNLTGLLGLAVTTVSGLYCIINKPNSTLTELLVGGLAGLSLIGASKIYENKLDKKFTEVTHQPVDSLKEDLEYLAYSQSVLRRSRNLTAIMYPEYAEKVLGEKQNDSLE